MKGDRRYIKLSRHCTLMNVDTGGQEGQEDLAKLESHKLKYSSSYPITLPAY